MTTEILMYAALTSGLWTVLAGSLAANPLVGERLARRIGGATMILSLASLGFAVGAVAAFFRRPEIDFLAWLPHWTALTAVSFAIRGWAAAALRRRTRGRRRALGGERDRDESDPAAKAAALKFDRI